MVSLLFHLTTDLDVSFRLNIMFVTPGDVFPSLGVLRYGGSAHNTCQTVSSPETAQCACNANKLQEVQFTLLDFLLFIFLNFLLIFSSSTPDHKHHKLCLFALVSN